MLIVDDQLNCIKNLISSILKNEEKIRLIDVATNGIEALNILNKNKIDIILLDLKMPKMNGVELIKKLEKQQNNIYEKSIIIITGEVSMLKEILRSPLVYSFHLKPTSQENLLKNLNDIITEKIRHFHSFCEFFVFRRNKLSTKYNFEHFRGKYASFTPFFASNNCANQKGAVKITAPFGNEIIQDPRTSLRCTPRQRSKYRRCGLRPQHI